jgi:hypothetical protein
MDAGESDGESDATVDYGQSGDEDDPWDDFIMVSVFDLQWKAAHRTLMARVAEKARRQRQERKPARSWVDDLH